LGCPNADFAIAVFRVENVVAKSLRPSSLSGSKSYDRIWQGIVNLYGWGFPGSIEQSRPRCRMRQRRAAAQSSKIFVNLLASNTPDNYNDWFVLKQVEAVVWWAIR
jgi:hypothetical protein